MLTQENITTLIEAVNTASHRWKRAFNSGDAIGCTAQYEETAVISVKPIGVFSGASEIQSFWQKLIDDGFSNVEYLEPQIDVLDQTSAVLSSRWRMNKAHGIIQRELWVLQQDGTAKLREDNFEILSV